MWKVGSGGREGGKAGVNDCRCSLLCVTDTVVGRTGCVSGAVDIRWSV